MSLEELYLNSTEFHALIDKICGELGVKREWLFHSVTCERCEFDPGYEFAIIRCDAEHEKEFGPPRELTGAELVAEQTLKDIYQPVVEFQLRSTAMMFDKLVNTLERTENNESEGSKEAQ